ncbi:MAG TPA: hypothetical protein VJU77_15055 [Chthoniobacterales bacterium]|nr:hypothetical protein [Chthoniobacterales bacterium]
MTDDLEHKRSNALEQYKELCETCRYYDAKFWSFPATAFTFEAAGLQFLLGSPRSGWQPIVVAAMLTMVFFGFTYQLIRFRSYQLVTEMNARALLSEYFPHLRSFNQFTKLGRLSHRDGAAFYSRLAGFSSTSYMIVTMLVFTLFNMGLTATFVRRLCDPNFLSSIMSN